MVPAQWACASASGTLDVDTGEGLVTGQLRRGVRLWVFSRYFLSFLLFKYKPILDAFASIDSEHTAYIARARMAGTWA